MTAYLITWKSNTENKKNGWPEHELSRLVQSLESTGKAIEPWRFSRRSGLVVGERVFLLRQGRKGHAILGYGRIADLPKPGDVRVPISFDMLVEPSLGDVLATQEEIREIDPTTTAWNTQSSGIRLDDVISSKLEKLVVGRKPIPDIKPESKTGNPDWTRDELILALDLYFRVPAARGSKTHPECVKLSASLNALPIHRGNQGKTFRNPNGVGMKLSNFLRYDPTYSGAGLRGGSHLEKEVWDKFSGDLPLLRGTADAILAGAAELSNGGISVDDEEEDGESEEGRVLTAVHKRRERDPKLVRRKKAQVLTQTGALKCEVCNFDFATIYGELGRGFAECHHGRPVSMLLPGDKTKLSELHIVCANCHRMLHRERPWISVYELRKKLKSILD